MVVPVINVYVVPPTGGTIVVTVPVDVLGFNLLRPGDRRRTGQAAILGSCVLRLSTMSILLAVTTPQATFMGVPLQYLAIYEIPCLEVIELDGYRFGFYMHLAEEVSDDWRECTWLSMPVDQTWFASLIGYKSELQAFSSIRGIVEPMRTDVCPVWLAGPRHAANDDDDFSLFYHWQRVRSSANTWLAVTYPFPESALFRRELDALPAFITDLHLILSTRIHWTGMIATLAQLCSQEAITHVSIDCKVSDWQWNYIFDALPQGNLTSIAWFPINDNLAAAVVCELIRVNHLLDKLAIGGYSGHILQVLEFVRSGNTRLTSLTVDLGEATNAEDILHVISTLDCPLWDLHLKLPSLACALQIRMAITKFWETLVILTVTLATISDDATCDDFHRYIIIPPIMPRLKNVKLVDIPCVGGGVNQLVGLRDGVNFRLKIKGSTHKCFCSGTVDVRALPSVAILELNPPMYLAQLPFNRALISALILDKVTLGDVPKILRFSRQIQILILNFDYPSNQPGVILHTHECPGGLIDDFFTMDTHETGVTLRDCRSQLVELLDHGCHCYCVHVFFSDLREFRLRFDEIMDDKWNQAVVGQCLFDNGIRLLPELRSFECSKVTSALWELLHEHQQVQDEFHADVSVYPLVQEIATI